MADPTAAVHTSRIEYYRTRGELPAVKYEYTPNWVAPEGLDVLLDVFNIRFL